MLINSAKLAREIRESSRVWPYYTPWTLADVKTAAWLVKKGHLSQLETVVFSSDLDASTLFITNYIKNVATYKQTKSDDEIFIQTRIKITDQGIF